MLVFFLKVIKQSFLETLPTILKQFNYDYTEDHEQAWDKFLTLTIEHLIMRRDEIEQSTEVTIATDVNQKIA